MTRRRIGGPGGLAGRGMTRRGFLRMGGVGLAGAALLGSGTLAACGGGGGSFNGEIVVGFGREESGALEALIKRFNEENQDLSVRWRRMPSDTGAYFDQLRTEFQAQSDDISVIAGDVIWPAQFAANGYIVDLSDRFTEEMRGQFLPGPVESNTYNGSVWGVPWFTDAGLLYYRTDYLEEAGFSEPPATWAELKDQASKIVQDGIAKTGFLFQGAEYEGGTVNGLEYINSHGGQVLDPSDASQVTIDSPESVAGLTTEHSMIEDGVSPQAVSTYDEPACEAPFFNGDAAFVRNWPYMYTLLPDNVRNNVDIAPLPAGEGGTSVSGLGGWNFFVNAYASEEAQEAAWEFISFMTAEAQQKFYAIEGSYLPTRSALYEDQEVADQVPTVRLAPDALANTVPRPVSPVYSDMSLEMAEQFNASLGGDVSPEEAISTLQEQLQSIADQAPS